MREWQLREGMWLLRDAQLVHGRAYTLSHTCLTLSPRPFLPLHSGSRHPDPPVAAAYLWPLLSLAVKGVPNNPRLGPGNAPLHKLSVYILLHKGPGACTAALALVEKQGEVGLLHGPVH